MMKQLHDFPGDVVAVVSAGHVTRADYDTVLIPAVERARSKPMTGCGSITKSLRISP